MSYLDIANSTPLYLVVGVILLFIAALFIFSFLLSPMTLLVSLILVCTLSEAMMNGQWRSRIIYLAVLSLASILLCIGAQLIAPGSLDLYHSLLIVTVVSLLFAVFMNALEVLVAFLQAYVFTMLSGVFIGLAQEGNVKKDKIVEKHKN